MFKLIAVSLFIIIATCVTAQTNPEKYAAIITASDLKKHLSIVAGPEMEGRETSSEGQRKAATYIETYFRSLNLLPGNAGSYQQKYSLMEDSMVSSTIKIGKQEYVYGKDFIMYARTNKNRQIESGSIIFGGYGISDSLYNDYDQLNIEGAIVVLTTGLPSSKNIKTINGNPSLSTWSLTRKVQEAYNKGAAGVFVISRGMVTIDSNMAKVQRLTGPYLPHKNDTGAINNYAFISHDLFGKIFKPDNAKSLLQKLDSASTFSLQDHISVKEQVAFNYTSVSYEKGTSSNVIAVIEGSDKKDEYVFLTAHYDHLGIRKGGVIYYGADDDGSGTVSVLEMATAFAKAKADGNGPRRTMVFMTVSGEEEGLWGSEYYTDHPLFPLEKTSVDLNTDMVGRIDPKRTYGDSMNYVYVIGDNKLSSDLKPISEMINNKYSHLELDYKYNDPKDQERIYYRSDHYNFARKGVPIIFYFNGTHADYHRPTDTIDKINFDLMEKRDHLIFYTAWEMANRNQMLKRDIPLQ